jgi:hypothetical protein
MPLPLPDSTDSSVGEYFLYKCVFYTITFFTCDSQLYLWQHMWKNADAEYWARFRKCVSLGVVMFSKSALCLLHILQLQTYWWVPIVVIYVLII